MRQRRYTITKFLSWLFLITMLAFIVPAPALAVPASDISNHWAKDQITDWYNLGLIKGYSDGTFKPENGISRAEFMVLINGAAGYTEKAAINYKDVPAGAWYEDVVAKAKAAGYISGYKEGTIEPNSPISRQEAASVIMTVCKLEPNAAAAEKMKDAKWMAAASKSAVGAVINAKIMGGYPDGTFRGENPLTRAEAVIALSRALSARIATLAAPVPPVVTPAAPSDSATVYDKAGTFGPATGTDTVKGNVTIKAKDVIFQNVIVEGDLTIDKAVGDGNVTLKNVTVKGTIYVNGGGANSVYFIDTKSGKTCVSRIEGTVRIVASGTTEISQLIAQSSVKVQESADLTGKGVEDLIIEKTVSSSTEVTLDGAEIATLQIKTAGVTVNTDKNTWINSLVADVAVRIKGTGTVDKASINASGVLFDVKPTSITVAPGVSAPTVDTTVSTSDSSDSSDSSTTVISAFVATATELTAALANPNITTITFNADITASPVITRSVTINLGAYTLTGDLSFTHSGTGTSVLSGSDGTRIIGSLSVDTPNASFTNGVTVSGTVNVINVEIGTWTEAASGNRLTISDSNGAVITVTGNPDAVIVTQTASGSLTLTVKPGATVASISSNAPIAITVSSGATVDNITAGGAGTTITNNGTTGTVTANAPVTIVNAAGASVDNIIAGTGADNSTITNNGTAGTVTANVPINLVANAAPAQTVAGTSGSFTTTGTNAASVVVAADTTPPVVSAASASDITATTAILNFKSNEIGIYYYLVKAAADAAPDAAAIAAQSTAVAKGMGDITPSLSKSEPVTGLSASTAYKAYLIAKDAAGNASIVSTIDLTTTAPGEQTVPVRSILLNKSYLALKTFDSQALVARVIPTDATNQELVWSTSRREVAIVNEDGMVYSAAPGTATISVISRASGIMATCRVSVSRKNLDLFSGIIHEASVSLMVDPAAGETPIAADALYSGYGNRYAITSLTWLNEDGSAATLVNGKFKANTTYQAQIVLTAVNNCAFNDDNNDLTIPVTVNGTAATGTIDGVYYGNKATVVLSFPATRAAAAAISTAGVIGVAAPVTGAAPIAVGALTAENPAYTVTSVTWLDADGVTPATLTSGKFNANLTYKARIVLTAAAGYKFPPGLTPTVNAGTAGMGTVAGGNISGNTLTFLVYFPATATIISAIEVTGVAAPVTSAVPIGRDALSAGHPSYTVTSLTWLNGDDSPATLTSGQFNAGTAYKAQIVLTSAAGYKFPPGLTPTVNAGTATAGTIAGGNVSGNKLTFVVYFPDKLANISAAEVTGVAAPVTGAAPIGRDALSAGYPSYTVTSLTWLNGDDSPATLTSGQFNPSSTYKARIELTSAAGYKFPAAGLTPTVNAGTATAGTAAGGDVTGNTLTFVVTFPATGAPTYATTLGTITRAAGDTDSTVSISGSPAAAGATVTLTLTPKAGMQLKAGTLKASYNNGTAQEAVLSGTGPYSFTMPAYAVTVTAEFEAIPAVTYATTLGTITRAAGDTDSTVSISGSPAAAGATVTITLTPKAGMQLKAGTLKANYNNGTAQEAVLSGSGPYSFTMPAYAVTVTAEFEAIPAVTYATTLGTITRAAGDTDSTVSISGSPAAAGATVTLTLTPKAGMQLKAGTLKASYNNGTAQEAVLSGSGPYSFTMPAYAVTVTAEFEVIPAASYATTLGTITRAAGDTDSTVSISGSPAAVGATVTLTVTPKSGMRLKTGTLKANYGTAQGAALTQTGEFIYTFAMPANVVTVTAEFEPDSPVTSATTNGNTITLAFAVTIDQFSASDANGFTVGGTLTKAPVTVTRVDKVSGGVMLTLDKQLVAGDIIKVSYDKTSAGVKLTNFGTDIASFSNQSVENKL